MIVDVCRYRPAYVVSSLCVVLVLVWLSAAARICAAWNCAVFSGVLFSMCHVWRIGQLNCSEHDVHNLSSSLLPIHLYSFPTHYYHLITEQTFKMRTLETAQSTMEKLLAERKKREKELDLLRTSEPRLMNELSTLRESMVSGGSMVCCIFAVCGMYVCSVCRVL